MGKITINSVSIVELGSDWEIIETMAGNIYAKKFVNKSGEEEYVVVSYDQITVRETLNFEGEPIAYIEVDMCNRYSKGDNVEIEAMFEKVKNEEGSEMFRTE